MAQKWCHFIRKTVSLKNTLKLFKTTIDLMKTPIHLIDSKQIIFNHLFINLIIKISSLYLSFDLNLKNKYQF